MRGNIGVRINDGTNDRTVTRLTRGLKFSKQADGGHRAASFTITTPLGALTDLGPSDRAYLYDTRHGGPLFDGYTEAPTPTSGPNGEGYAISALGGMIRAADETRSLMYVDHDLQVFEADPAMQTSASFDTGKWVQSAAFPRLRTVFSSGSLLVTNDVASAGNYSAGRDAHPLGGIRVGSLTSGKSDTSYSEQIQSPTGNVFGRAMSTTGTTNIVKFAGDTNFPSNTVPVLWLRTQRIGGATNVADEQTWSDWADVSVIGQRVNRFGTLLTGSSGLRSAQNVLASEVAEDLLGRLLRFCDPVTSSVATTSFLIDQLAYHDGTTAQRVLDDLSDYEPDCLWEILHSTSAGHIFNYRLWPTDARYEISTSDGYVESGADAGLCNRVAVTWTDSAGNQQTTIVTATSATHPALKALEDAGRIRDADPVTLPDGTGSLTNAQALGAAILEDTAGQPTPARAVVRRPIRDLYTGATVMPWEIEPGYLVMVREKGNLMRLTAMEYDDDSVSTSLELGYPSRTRDQRIARLARN